MSDQTESTTSDRDNLTLEKLLSTIRSFKPVPQMPRWKDLTWAQRNMVEQEIRATESPLVRNAMWANYYRDDDHAARPATGELGGEG